MTYKILDLREGLLADGHIVEADSPKRAVEKLGYKTVERDISGGGDVVVYGGRRSYVYKAAK